MWLYFVYYETSVRSSERDYSFSWNRQTSMVGVNASLNSFHQFQLLCPGSRNTTEWIHLTFPAWSESLNYQVTIFWCIMKSKHFSFDWIPSGLHTPLEWVTDKLNSFQPSRRLSERWLQFEWKLILQQFNVFPLYPIKHAPMCLWALS